jgi:hypothetical protein
MLEIILVWKYFNGKRFGAFMAAGVIGGLILVGWHHLLGIEQYKDWIHYTYSFAIGIGAGFGCGVIAAAADFGSALRRASQSKRGLLIRIVPDIYILLASIVGLAIITGICFGLLFWSDYVYGFGAFGHHPSPA